MPKYYASNLGNIKSTKKYGKDPERLLTPYKDKYGYNTVHIIVDKKHKTLLVHRLVMFSHLPNSNENSLVVNHKNGIKTDNQLDNLEWCTVKENTDHAIRLGIAKSVNDVRPAPKLSYEIAEKIRAEYKPRVISRNKLAAKYSVDKSTIDRVLAGSVWIKPGALQGTSTTTIF